MENEYKIEALKEAFDGERTDVYTKHILVDSLDEKGLKAQVEHFVRFHQAQRFNVWLKVKV
jgi:hypothetical protein